LPPVEIVPDPVPEVYRRKAPVACNSKLEAAFTATVSVPVIVTAVEVNFPCVAEAASKNVEVSSCTVNDPEPVAVPLPVYTVTAPPVVLPAPPLMTTAPPTLAPLVPAERVTPPAVPLDVPTSKDTLPAEPAGELPVLREMTPEAPVPDPTDPLAKVTAPVEPPAAVPELNTSAPLTAVEPALADRTNTPPVAAALPDAPLVTVT